MINGVGPNPTMMFDMTKIVPSGKTPKTASERLFATYLDQYGYSGWMHEPTIDDHGKHPDFVVPSLGENFLFEVKERRRKGGEAQFAWINPYKGIRKGIEKARTKFARFGDFPCSLIIHNAGDIDTLMKPEYVYGAMLGDLGFSFGVDTEEGVAFPDASRNVFLPQNGKMVASYTMGLPHNTTTTINAVIVLEKCRLRNTQFEHAIATAIEQKEKGATSSLTEDDRALTAVTLFFDLKPKWQSVVRVQVCENPWARVPLPRTIFCGPYDERWAIVDRKLVRVWHGSGVVDIED